MKPRPRLRAAQAAHSLPTGLLPVARSSGPVRRRLQRTLLVAAACLALCGCATKRIAPVDYASVSGKVHVGQRVSIAGRSYTDRSIKVREIRETCLVSDRHEEFPYEDMYALEYQGFSATALGKSDVLGYLALPLVPVGAVIIVVGGTVILVGSVTCFVLTGSEKCGALLTS